MGLLCHPLCIETEDIPINDKTQKDFDFRIYRLVYGANSCNIAI